MTNSRNLGQQSELPCGWRWAQLGEVCEKPQYGYTASAETREVGPKLLRITDIQGGKVNWNKVPYCRCEDEVNRYILKPGDILIARTGGTTGKSYLINDIPAQAIFASYLIRVRAGKELVPEYIYQFLQSDLYWNQIEINKRGGAQPNMNASLISELSLPLPPLPEQRRIAAKIQELMQDVDRARAACEQQFEAAKSLPFAYLHEIFESEEAKNWESKKLGEVCKINPSRPRNFTRPPNTSTTFVPMAAVDDRTGTVAISEVVPYSKVSKGYTYFEENDVLFAKITPCMQNGKHVIARNIIDGIGFGSTEFHVLRPGKEILPEWIWYFVRRACFLQEATMYFSGAVGQQRVPENFLANYSIPCPPLSVQKHLMAELNEKTAGLEKIYMAAKKQLDIINVFPPKILNRAFKGEL